MSGGTEVIRTVSSHDEMVFPGQEASYFQIGERVIELVRMAQKICGRKRLPKILDLPCGHGRVTRWLRAEFPYAELTACDLNRHGVDFCTRHFNAVGQYSEEDLNRVEFPHAFDLVWCGSLLTHLPLEAQLTTLSKLVEWTGEDGILIFSVQGRFLASQLERGQADFADNVDVVGLLRDFRAHGTAYRPYYESQAGGYGLALNSPEYVSGLIQKNPGVILRAYLEQAWGVQDIVILYRKADYFTSILS